MQPPATLLSIIEAAANRYLAMDPVALRRMAELQDRVLEVELLDVDMRFFVLTDGQGVQILGRFEGEPDARLRGTPLAMMRLGLSGDASRQLFAGDVEISGDTELGQRFKQILDEIDIDWEEQLSHVTGDVVAHQAGRVVRGLAGWARQAAGSLEQDTGEFLQEEARLVPARSEVEAFVEQVDELRTDVDRLEARVRRLQARVSDNSNNN